MDQKKSRKHISNPVVNEAILDSVGTLEATVFEIEKFRQRLRDPTVDRFDSEDQEELMYIQALQLEGLEHMLKKRIERKMSYLRLFSLLIFFSLYSVSLILQRDITSAFGVQTRFEPT